ncbi:MAG: PEP-CTERM sorting domain-containing protein [Deferrisomatales bacterium]
MGKLTRVLLAATAAVTVGAAGAFAGTVTLGAYSFDDRLFGDSLVEHDGGAHSAANWLNVDKVNPGNPGYLTGANFDTGVANMGFPWPTTGPYATITYTIRYNTPIGNFGGQDLGVVVARGSTKEEWWDSFHLAVSTDGIDFSAPLFVDKKPVGETGVQKSYWWRAADFDGVQGYAPPLVFPAELYVHLIDLDDFNISPGAGVVAIKIWNDNAADSQPELDLIRVAGFRPVPEPATGLLLGSGLALLAAWGRRRRG